MYQTFGWLNRINNYIDIRQQFGWIQVVDESDGDGD